jgi:hypothetical protein
MLRLRGDQGTLLSYPAPLLVCCAMPDAYLLPPARAVLLSTSTHPRYFLGR